MPVIPYIVGAASVNRNCGIGEQLLLFFRKILYSYIHDFPITVLWNKRSNGGLQEQRSGSALYRLPHKACSQLTVILERRKFLALLFAGGACCRVNAGILYRKPEVPA